MLREPSFDCRLDPESVSTALLGILGPESTLFRGVKRLAPGHELVLAGGVLTPRPYWQPPAVAPCEPPGASGELRELLRAAVARLAEEQPIACALSGGVDSAGLLALLCEARPSPLAFTLCDRGREDDEIARAEQVAAAFGARLETVEVAEEDLPEHAVDAVLACESLLFNGRAVAKHLFYRALGARAVRSVLSGVGADEIFLGEPQALSAPAGGEPAFLGPMRRDGELARSLLCPAWAERVPPIALPPAPPGEAALAFAREVMLRTVLPDATLPPESRAAASAGIELRLPYLEREVVEFALRLPLRALVRGAVGKWLLRELWRGVIPDSVRLAPKTPRLAEPGGSSRKARSGWSALYDAWLSLSRVTALEVFNPAAVRALVEAFARRRAVDGSTLGVMDRVLFRLTSLSVLNERLAGSRPE